MSKLSKQKNRVADAKRIAFGLVKRRKQLLALKQKADQNGELSEGQVIQMKRLIERINSSKAALKVLGFEPKEAADWAQAEQKKKSTPSNAVPKKKQKKSGVGMYNLGNSIKIWK